MQPIVTKAKQIHNISDIERKESAVLITEILRKVNSKLSTWDEISTQELDGAVESRTRTSGGLRNLGRKS